MYYIKLILLFQGLFKTYSKDYRERLDGPAHIFQYDQGIHTFDYGNLIMFNVFCNTND